MNNETATPSAIDLLLSPTLFIRTFFRREQKMRTLEDFLRDNGCGRGGFRVMVIEVRRAYGQFKVLFRPDVSLQGAEEYYVQGNSLTDLPRAVGARQATRITPESVHTELVREVQYDQPHGTNSTVCTVTTRSGFTVIGESHCLDRDLFDAAKGRSIALQNALERLCTFEAYLLAERRCAYSAETA